MDILKILEMMKTTFDSEKKLWKGIKSPYMFGNDVFLGEKIFESLKSDPDRLLQIYHDEEKNLKADEFLTSIIRVAQNLLDLRIQSNDVAGVVCLNSNATVIFINACIMIGVPPNTLDVSFTVDDIGHMFSQTRPKLVICDYDVYLKVKHALKNIKNDAIIFTIGKVAGARNFDELM